MEVQSGHGRKRWRGPFPEVKLTATQLPLSYVGKTKISASNQESLPRPGLKGSAFVPCLVDYVSRPQSAAKQTTNPGI
jgi:hypothetical protein